jgi:hypothetical protein
MTHGAGKSPYLDLTLLSDDIPHEREDAIFRQRHFIFFIPTPSPQPAGSFTANWWQATADGSVKMSTNVPVINIGGADLTLTTNQQGPLGQLIGGSSTGFPIIQQFNTFGAAHMEVSE